MILSPRQRKTLMRFFVMSSRILGVKNPPVDLPKGISGWPCECPAALAFGMPANKVEVFPLTTLFIGVSWWRMVLLALYWSLWDGLRFKMPAYEALLTDYGIRRIRGYAGGVAFYITNPSILHDFVVNVDAGYYPELALDLFDNAPEPEVK